MILCGDSLTLLRTLPEASVDCCVTSPPYWGLRDYGVEGQIGLEPTAEEFIMKLVDVFRQVRRVLKPKGTLWLILGDTYAASAGSRGAQGKHGEMAGRAVVEPRERVLASKRMPRGTGRWGGGNNAVSSLKPKDLVGIPWRVALALQADGWWLRADIAWCKANPMPESVKDRPTKAHEYVFLLTKGKRYYYDQNAVKESASPDSHARYARGRSENHKWANGGPGNQTIAKSFEHMKRPSGWNSGPTSEDGIGRYRQPGVNPKALADGNGMVKQNASFSAAVRDLVEMRNLRSWWIINTEATPEAHFATFPIRLAERCILLGCPERGTVLDPFAGAGTTWLACLKHGREFRGIELKAEYIAIAEQRAQRLYPLLVAAFA